MSETYPSFSYYMVHRWDSVLGCRDKCGGIVFLGVFDMYTILGLFFIF